MYARYLGISIDKISNLAATLIAFLALLASQFNPIHEYFSEAQITIGDPLNVELVCTRTGPALAADISVQNIGDAFAHLSEVRVLFQRLNTDEPIAFGHMRVRSSRRSLTGSLEWDPFQGDEISPSERWVGRSILARELSNPEFAAITQAHAKLDTVVDYHLDVSLNEEDFNKNLIIDNDLADSVSRALSVTHSWLEEGQYEVTFELSWLDEESKKRQDRLVKSLSMPGDAINFFNRRYSSAGVAEDPSFFNGCRIPLAFD